MAVHISVALHSTCPFLYKFKNIQCVFVASGPWYFFLTQTLLQVLPLNRWKLGDSAEQLQRQDFTIKKWWHKQRMGMLGIRSVDLSMNNWWFWAHDLAILYNLMGYSSVDDLVKSKVGIDHNWSQRRAGLFSVYSPSILTHVYSDKGTWVRLWKL